MIYNFIFGINGNVELRSRLLVKKLGIIAMRNSRVLKSVGILHDITVLCTFLSLPPLKYHKIKPDTKQSLSTLVVGTSQLIRTQAAYRTDIQKLSIDLIPRFLGATKIRSVGTDCEV